MAQTIASLLIKIGVQVSEVNKGFKQVENKMKGLQKGFKNTAKQLGLIFGGTQVLSGIKNIVKASNEFQLDLAKLNNTAGLSVDELNKVGNSAQQLAGKFGVSSNEIVHGLTELTKLSYSTADSLREMPQLLKFNIATGAKFETTIGLMETTLKDFGKSMDYTGKATDIFTAAIGKGRLSTNDLADAFKKAGASGKNAGASVSDVAAAVSKLAIKGFSGAEAGTALNAIFGNLTKTGGTADKALKSLGISVTTSTGQMRPFGEVVTDIQKKMAGMTDQQKNLFAQQIAGKEHMAKFLAIVSGAPKSFEAYSASLEGAKGSTETAFKGIDQTASQSLKKLEESFNTFQQKLGIALSPAITVVVNAITELINWFNQLSPTTQTVISTIAAVVASLVALGAIVATISFAISALAPVVTALGAVFAFLTGPIGIVIAIIAALVAGITLLWKKNEGFRTAVISIWNGIKSFFSAIPGFFSKIWSNVVNATTNAFNAIMNKVKNLGSSIKSFFIGLASLALSWGSHLIGNFIAGIGRMAGRLIAKVKSIANTVKSFLGFSVPDKGPLSDADKWMPDFINLMSRGLQMGIPKLQMAVGEVATTLAGDGATSNTVNNTYNANVNMTGRAQTGEQVARGINRHWMMSGVYS